MQVDPHRTDVVLAATSNGLLFRSIDGGYIWKALPSPSALEGTLHVFSVDPKRRDTYFVGLASDSPVYSGLYRTRDGGATWELLPGLAGQEIWSLAIWAGDSRVMAAGVRDGVFLTRDGGDKWTRISPAQNRELQPVVSLAFDPANNRILYAGTPHLPWKTVDGGGAWRSIHQGMADDSDVFSIDIIPRQPSRVFASACSGIYMSLNSGAAWRKLTGAKGASYRTYFVAQDPRNPGVVFAGTNHGLVRSSDGGRTWRQLSTNPTRSIAFDPAHSWRTFVATDEAGILRSNDRGKTFIATNDGFCNRLLPGLAVAGGAVYTNSIYEFPNGGLFQFPVPSGPWRRVPPPTRLLGDQILAIAAAPDSPQRIYAAALRGLMISPDAGHTWAISPLPGGSRIAALLVVPRTGGRIILAGAESGLYRSDNEGGTWTRVELPDGKLPVRALVRLKPTLFCAMAGSRLFFSPDGVSWKLRGLVPDKTEVLGVAASGPKLFAATSLGLMKSDDQGGSWQPAGGLEGNTVSAICAHPTQVGVLFAAQYGIIYISNDNGGSWKRTPSESLLLNSVRELQVLPGTPDRIFALTRTQGVFALALEARASVPFAAP